MNENEKVHLGEQNAAVEICDEALDQVSGGASANGSGIICKYCGKGDSFVWASMGNGASGRYCTRCKRFYY